MLMGAAAATAPDAEGIGLTTAVDINGTEDGGGTGIALLPILGSGGGSFCCGNIIAVLVFTNGIIFVVVVVVMEEEVDDASVKAVGITAFVFLIKSRG